MRMRELLYAFVDRVGRTDAENENSSDERPEKPFFSVTERMLARSWPLVKTQTQQEKDLVSGIGDRVKRLSHHARGAGNNSSKELQYRDQSVGKERAEYGQHTRVLQLAKMTGSVGLWRKNPSLAIRVFPHTSTISAALCVKKHIERRARADTQSYAEINYL